LRAPGYLLKNMLPKSVLDWVNGFGSDMLFARMPWINPRRYPWRFAAALGLLVGVGLLLAQLVVEGPPPSLQTGAMVVGIFLSVELCAVLTGFAVLGGYLGLRPLTRTKRR
jgi:hypothetical protein